MAFNEYPAYNEFKPVAPSDTVDFIKNPDALFVGGAGALVLVNPDGTTSTFAAVPAGTLLPVTCKRVNSTGTIATAIVALYRV